MTLKKSVNVNVQDNENTHVDVNVIFGNSYQYNDLRDQLKTHQEFFDLIPESDTERRLIVSAKINELTDQIEQFKQDVLKLAEAFQNIEINTDRLKRAKEFFDKGEIGEARAVLETELEQMQSEQKHLLREREHYEIETLPKLQNNSEEFYLLALSTQSDYTNPNRFEDVCQYFQSSIESHLTKSNIFYYAIFLQEQNQFPEAEYHYNLYLEQFKNEIDKNEYATTLNNLAVLHRNQNKYDDALKEYEESLQIYRQLAETNLQTYLPYVAGTLNNLASLHQYQNKYDKALKEYEEALQIRRKLFEEMPEVYAPYISSTLINLSILYQISVPVREKSIEYAVEAVMILLPIVEKFPYTQKYLETAMTVLARWSLNDEEIDKLVEEKREK